MAAAACFEVSAITRQHDPTICATVVFMFTAMWTLYLMHPFYYIFTRHLSSMFNFCKQAYKAIVLQMSHYWPTNKFPFIYLNICLIEKFSIKFVEITFYILTNKMYQLKYNKTGQTLHVRYQLLHVSAPRCHPQGVY